MQGGGPAGLAFDGAIVLHHPPPERSEAGAAAGHSSVLVTSVYLHVAVEETGEVGRLFGVG